MKRFFYVVNDQKLGPSTIEELISVGINDNTLVWSEGMADWTRAGSLPEITQFFKKTPPPLPPPLPFSVVQETNLWNLQTEYNSIAGKASIDLVETANKIDDDDSKLTFKDFLGSCVFTGLVYWGCVSSHTFTHKYYGWWIFGFLLFCTIGGFFGMLSNNNRKSSALSVEKLPSHLHSTPQRRNSSLDIRDCKWCGNELNMRGNAKTTFGGWDVCSQKCRKELSSSINRGEMRVKNYRKKRVLAYLIFFIVLAIAAALR